ATTTGSIPGPRAGAATNALHAQVGRLGKRAGVARNAGGQADVGLASPGSGGQHGLDAHGAVYYQLVAVVHGLAPRWGARTLPCRLYAGDVVVGRARGRAVEHRIARTHIFDVRAAGKHGGRGQDGEVSQFHVDVPVIRRVNPKNYNARASRRRLAHGRFRAERLDHLVVRFGVGAADQVDAIWHSGKHALHRHAAAFVAQPFQGFADGFRLPGQIDDQCRVVGRFADDGNLAGQNGGG